MPDQTTPAEFVKLRDQLALDLGAIVIVPSQARRSAEYLLASGLVPLDRIEARYEETHPEPVAEPEAEPETPKWARGEGIEVGAEVEYVGGGEHESPNRIGTRGKITGTYDGGRRVYATKGIDASWSHNLQRIS